MFPAVTFGPGPATLQRADDGGGQVVGDDLHVTLAALAGVAERDLIFMAGHMLAEDRRQPEGAVVGRVLIAA
jgi:hypothetical protein